MAASSTSLVALGGWFLEFSGLAEGLFTTHVAGFLGVQYENCTCLILCCLPGRLALMGSGCGLHDIGKSLPGCNWSNQWIPWCFRVGLEFTEVDTDLWYSRGSTLSLNDYGLHTLHPSTFCDTWSGARKKSLEEFAVLQCLPKWRVAERSTKLQWMQICGVCAFWKKSLSSGVFPNFQQPPNLGVKFHPPNLVAEVGRCRSRMMFPANLAGGWRRLP